MIPPSPSRRRAILASGAIAGRASGTGLSVSLSDTMPTVREPR
jgi:hypothetical protein